MLDDESVLSGVKDIRLFGFKVMVERVAEKTGSIIIVPDMAKNLLWQIGRVVVVGDGRQPDGKIEEPLVNTGDLVYFQTNAVIAAAQGYERGSEFYLNLHQGDLLARLAANTINYDNFEPLGRWVLVEPFSDKNPGGILLPDTATEQVMRFRVAKLGSRVGLPIAPGQEVILNTGRVCPLGIPKLDLVTGEIRAKPFAYVDRDFVMGTVGDAS